LDVFEGLDSLLKPRLFELLDVDAGSLKPSSSGTGEGGLAEGGSGCTFDGLEIAMGGGRGFSFEGVLETLSPQLLRLF